MKLIVNEKEKNFVFELEGYDQTVTFQEVYDSFSWKQFGIVTVQHARKNENGLYNSTSFTRGQFLEMMKFGREHYYRSKGVWEYNTGVHKLYAVLDGETLAEAEAEVENLSKQHEEIWKASLEWNNERVKRYYKEECSLEALKCIMYPDNEVTEKMALHHNKMKRIDKELPPFDLREEMEKLYIAARDTKQPKVKLSNVTPSIVKGSYISENKAE